MRTDRGLVRDNNEDAIGGDLTTGLVVLADGMGGANAGEVASTLAVDLLINELVVARDSDAGVLGEQDLQASAKRVNAAILDLAQNVPEYHGMGTTLIVGLFQRESLLFAHVGDSRLYLYRQHELQVLTRDHTLIQELVALGEFQSLEDALSAGVPQNILARAFGSESEVEIDIDSIPLQSGDLLMFCSDGLTNMVSDQEIKQILELRDAGLMTRVDGLIERACMNGGADNVSVILAEVSDNENREKKGR
jgi:protein phosphatase